MARELYQKIDELNPNYESYVLTLVQGEDLDEKECFGEKALISNHKIVFLSQPDGFFSEHETEAAAVAESGILTLAGKKVYSELLGRAKKMVICGAGHVSMPIIKMAKMIGFMVTCIDDRPHFADNAKKAGADQAICEEFETALGSIPGDSDTYFVIVTRGHRYDQDCLGAIANMPHAYIGLMGSKRRVTIVKEKLAEEGVSREVLDSVCTPIGLAIGAETPEEIAVSVMAEVIQHKNGSKRSYGYPMDMLERILDMREEGRAVLSTIIASKGSAPRKAGTKMLIYPDGLCIGTVGGGLAEAEIMRKGQQMLAGEETGSVIYRVDLSNEAAAAEGMVCGGVLDVLMEVIG